MRILPGYLVKLHVAPFAFTLTALTSLLLLNQIAKRFESLVGKGLHWTVMVEFFALTIPFLLAMTIPMTVLVTVLYTFSRLAADQEITALKSAGVSTGQMMRPVLGAAILVAAGSFLIGDQLVPRTNHRLRTLMTDIDRKKPVFAIREQVINEVRRNKIFLRAARVDAATHRIIDVTIWDLTHNRNRIIYADSGEMAFDETRADLYVTLFDGVMREIDRTDPSVFEQVEFETNVILVADVGNELSRTISDNFRGDREMGVCALGEVIRQAEREAALTGRQLEALRSNFLRQLVGLSTIAADSLFPLAEATGYCLNIEPLFTSMLPTPLAAREPQDSLVRDRQSRRFTPTPTRTYAAGTVPSIPQSRIRSLDTRNRQARIRAARNMIEMHKKYALAIACIVFVIIGVPIALKFPRGGVDLVIGVSIVIFGIYYVGLIAGEALGDRLTVPPQFAMWFANAVFTATGLLLLIRLRNAATPRSQSRTLRNLFTRKRASI